VDDVVAPSPRAGLIMSRRAWLLVWLLGACAGDPDEPAVEIEVRRVADTVAVRHRRGDQELARIDVRLEGGVLRVSTWFPESTGTIELAATGPGVPVTGKLRVEDAAAARGELEVRNGRLLGGALRPSISDPVEHDLAHAALLDGPIVAHLAKVAPYRIAIVARLAEAAPLFDVVGLFQPWPAGVEPAWPQLDDPRDLEPPGHLASDVVGLGMTCSPQIRCPNSAPFCVSVDHAAAFGFCTRACADDLDCGPSGGRCSLSVVDIPDVPTAVTTCQLDCSAAACPGLLRCREGEEVCLPPG
jgi:hypothetical protein